MTINQPPSLGREDLAALAEAYGLGKLAPGSGPIPGWGTRRYRLQTNKGHYEVRLRPPDEAYEVLRREIELLGFLEKHDFASPRVVPDPNGRPYAEYDGWLLVVLRVPAGEYLTEKDLTLRQIHSTGRLLGTLHTVGRAYKKTIENRFGFDRIFEMYATVRRRLPPYFKKLIRTLDEETEYLGNYLETKLPKGVIHGNVHLWCLLFKGDRVVSLGDFDAACRGKYVYDLATAVNALCFCDGSYSLERFEALLAGYESLRTLSLAEWDSFPNELRFAALRFAVTRLSEFFETRGEEAQRINKEFGSYFERLQVLRREKEGGMEGLLMAMATGYDYRKYQRIKSDRESD
ncbi:MAG: homoserine kinase [Candidatus Dadabacteria bacterium]|nr:MAG: homoserine kinase [Candidatus Dadabacteria bacterium]